MNKKGQFDDLLKMIIWIVVFLILIGGIYFLVRKLGL